MTALRRQVVTSPVRGSFIATSLSPAQALSAHAVTIRVRQRNGTCMRAKYRCYLFDRHGSLIETRVLACRNAAHAREQAVNLLILDPRIDVIEVWKGLRRIFRHARGD